MTKEEALTVKVGDDLILKDFSKTPGRTFSPILGDRVKIEKILIEPSDYSHFDIGMVITEKDNPLLSRDTGEELDGSKTYWLHPSRFDKINT